MGGAFVNVGVLLTMASVLFGWRRLTFLSSYTCGLGGGFLIAGCVLLAKGG